MAGLTYGNVRDWEAAPLATAADGVGKGADALEASWDKVESQTVPSSWLGDPSILATARRDRLVKRMKTHLEGERQLQKALYHAADQVEEIERLVEAVEAEAGSEKIRIGDDGKLTHTSQPPPDDTPDPEHEEWVQSRRSKAEAISAKITTIVSLAAATDAMITRSIPEGHIGKVDRSGTVAPEVAARWAELTDDDRQAIMVQLVEEFAEESGIETPLIDWDPDLADLGLLGEWRQKDRTSALNPDWLDDPGMLGSAAHEMRHARQREAIRDANVDANDWPWPWEDAAFDMHEEDGITRKQAGDWEKNIKDYTEPEEDFEEYLKQPVEEDAFDAEREYVEGLSKAELDRLLEAATGSAPG